jgi:hypothetical protein
MQVDLMQRFPMGIVGFSADRHDQSPGDGGAAAAVWLRLASAWSLAVDLVTVARARVLLRRSPPVDRPRSIDRVIDYFGEPRRPADGSPSARRESALRHPSAPPRRRRAGCYASRRVRTASS